MPEQDGRGDLVEVGDAIAGRGPHDAVAVAEREAGHVGEHGQVGGAVADVAAQRLEKVREGGFALAVHRDVDVRVVGEVALGVGLVLGRVGPAVDRDVVRVQLA